jgi:hypothetical protein
LIAQVVEPSGNPPHSGTQVSFTTTLGSIEPAEATTDTSGRAVATFKAGTSNGTATITAISGGVSASGNNAVKIAIGTAAVGRVIVGANPTLVPALGGSSTITATVLDINGNALSTAPVAFSTTAGSLSQLVVTSDANGAASTVLQTSTQAVVTASVGAQGTTTTNTGTTGTTGTTGSTAGQASGTVTVAVAAAPTLVITPPTTLPTVNLPATFTFVVTVPATNGSAVRSVNVNWGDGTTQELGGISGTNLISHVYHTVNIFSITAMLTDGSGNVVTVTTSVTVIPAALTLTITPPTTPPSAGLPANFTIVPGVPANTGDSVKNVRLDWGDGTAAQDLGAIAGSTFVAHVFAAAGTYVITGTLTDAAANVLTVTTSVTVNPKPQPAVSLTATTANPTAGVDLTFTASVAPSAGNGTVIKTVTVDFGDGSSKTDLGPVTGTSIALHHVYTTSGTYTAVLAATDSNGGVGTATTTVFVQAAVPLGVTVVTQKTVIDSNNTSVTFTATVTGLGNAVVQKYTWDFGDGTPTQDSTTNVFVHTYTFVGAHTAITAAKVTVTTSSNTTAVGPVPTFTP